MDPPLNSSRSELAPSAQRLELELELLIREARRRQRRRRLVTVLVFVLAALGVYLGTGSAGSPSRSGSLLSRPLHLPSLGPRGRCPVTRGYEVNNPYFGGDALGKGPVRVLLADGGDVLHGRVDIGTSAARRWLAMQTLWFAMPGYNGPFVVRGARLGKRGAIEVQPAGSGQSPGLGPLVVRGGPTLNSYPVAATNASHIYRTAPGATWVKSPGCYAWQVDGRGFSEHIVVEATTAPR